MTAEASRSSGGAASGRGRATSSSHRPSVPSVQGFAGSRDWWKHGVLYQIYPRSFQDSNGDGVGDLPGITSRLDHLNGRDGALGIDGIWISPFYKSPMKDYGYDVADYTDVDPQFGTLSDFDELLGQAHERGIRVIVDLVPNHTSDQHSWFIDSRSSRDNPKRDWYVWADPKPDGSPPNNWMSVFKRVGPAWTLDEQTRQYYLHLFLSEQPDLNWWNPQVRAAIDDVMRFWLDRGVDGFRIDVASALLHDPRLRDEHPTLAGRRRWPRAWGLPEVHDIHRHWRQLIDEYGDRMAVGEVSEDPARQLVRYYGRNDELHLSFYFYFLMRPWTASAFRRAVAEFEAELPPGTWPNYTLSNHDRPRAASRYGPDRARAAMLMLLTLRGTPFIYYGEEIGMTDVPIPDDRVVDVAGRDPERTPMQWDRSPNAGFSTGNAWLPLAADADHVNVQAQRADPGSMLSFTRRLIELRRRSPALTRGAYAAFESPRDVLAFVRSEGGERFLAAINFADRERRLDAANFGEQGQLELSTLPDREQAPLPLSRIPLAPNEGVVVRLTKGSAT